MQTIEEVDVMVIELFKDQSMEDAKEEGECIADLLAAAKAFGYDIPVEVVQKELRRSYARFEFFKRQVTRSPMDHAAMTAIAQENPAVLVTFLNYTQELGQVVESGGELLATMVMLELIKYGVEQH